VSIVEREQTTLPDFETWPTTKETHSPTIEDEALRLDRLFPGWADRINIKTLDMESPCNCILGQGAYVTHKMFFGFGTTITYLGYGRGRGAIDVDAVERNESIPLGAYCSTNRKQEWIAAINKRRTA